MYYIFEEESFFEKKLRVRQKSLIHCSTTAPIKTLEASVVIAKGAFSTGWVSSVAFESSCLQRLKAASEIGVQLILRRSFLTDFFK